VSTIIAAVDGVDLTCLQTSECDIFALGFVALGDDWWDPAQCQLCYTTALRHAFGDLLAASFAVFRHGWKCEFVVDGAFGSDEGCYGGDLVESLRIEWIRIRL
jgi:hypothetical protein